MGFLEFCVSASTEEDEFVGIVGSSPAIGEWQLSDAKKLTYDETTSNWKIKISFESPGGLVYRYFIASNVKSNDEKETVIVKKWESGPSIFARKVTVPSEGTETLQIDDGTFGIINNETMMDHGWLSGHTEVRFTFSDNGEAPMVSLRQCEIPTDQLQISLEAEGIIIHSELNTIRPYKYSKCNAADKVHFPKNDEVFTYIINVVDFESFSGHFTVYDKDGNVIGYSAVISDQLQESTSLLKSPVLSKTGKGIGSLHMEYVVIKSYDNKEALRMKEGFGAYWTKRPTLHIGHRGSGNSFTAETKSDIYENTLSSFRRASAHSAAMIEFDVQLTKDLIPIVFHDYTICASVSSKQGSKVSLHEVEVQSLTYNQLVEYQTRHRARRDSSSVDPEFDEDDSDPDLRPFPTLEEVLKEVPEHTGFDIELKWPFYDINKVWYHGVDKFPPANEFVDKILDVVFKYCGNRRIMFSSFDSNICVFLRRKQNRFPVILLVDEGSAMMDLRCRFNRLAIPFAASERLLGICFDEDSAYNDDQLVEKVHGEKLLAMFYGDRISEKKNRDLLIQRGADGIIYDRIHQALQQGPNIFQLTESSAPS